MDTATEIGIDAAKTACKRAVQKNAEATGDLIGNKTTDKITSIGKPKEKKKKKRKEKKKKKEFTSHEKKDNILLMTLDGFEEKMWQHCIKMEFQNIIIFLEITSDDKELPRFVAKNGFEVMINQNETTMLKKTLESKHQC